MRDRESNIASGLLVAGAVVAPGVLAVARNVGGLIEASRRRALIESHDFLARIAREFQAAAETHFIEIEKSLVELTLEAGIASLATARADLEATVQWFGAQNISEFVEENKVSAYVVKREMASFLARPVRVAMDEIRARHRSNITPKLVQQLKGAELMLVRFACNKLEVCIARAHEPSYVLRGGLGVLVKWAFVLATLGVLFLSMIIYLDVWAGKLNQVLWLFR